MSNEDMATGRRRRGPTGAELAAHRPRAEGTCQVCGGKLEGYAGKKFCSTRCQVADYRRRKREELAARR